MSRKIGYRQMCRRLLAAVLALWAGVLGVRPAFADLTGLRTPEVWKLFVESAQGNRSSPANKRGRRPVADSSAAEELKRRVCAQFAVPGDSARLVQRPKADAPFVAVFLWGKAMQTKSGTGASVASLGAIRDSRAKFRAYLRNDGLEHVNDFAFSKGTLLFNRSVQEISSKKPFGSPLKVRVTVAPWKLAVVTFFNSTDADKIPLRRLENAK